MVNSSQGGGTKDSFVLIADPMQQSMSGGGMSQSMGGMSQTLGRGA